MIELLYHSFRWRKFRELKEWKRKYCQWHGVGGGEKGNFKMIWNTISFIYIKKKLSNDKRIDNICQLWLLVDKYFLHYPSILVRKELFFIIWFIHSTNNLLRAYYVLAIKWRKKTEVIPALLAGICVLDVKVRCLGANVECSGHHEGVGRMNLYWCWRGGLLLVLNQ